MNNTPASPIESFEKGRSPKKTLITLGATFGLMVFMAGAVYGGMQFGPKPAQSAGSYDVAKALPNKEKGATEEKSIPAEQQSIGAIKVHTESTEKTGAGDSKPSPDYQLFYSGGDVTSWKLHRGGVTLLSYEPEVDNESNTLQGCENISPAPVISFDKKRAYFVDLDKRDTVLKYDENMKQSVAFKLPSGFSCVTGIFEDGEGRLGVSGIKKWGSESDYYAQLSAQTTYVTNGITSLERPGVWSLKGIIGGKDIVIQQYFYNVGIGGGAANYRIVSTAEPDKDREINTGSYIDAVIGSMLYLSTNIKDIYGPEATGGVAVTILDLNPLKVTKIRNEDVIHHFVKVENNKAVYDVYDRGTGEIIRTDRL